MGPITTLAAFTLRQMVLDSAAKFVEQLARYYADPSKALPRALNQANASTWQLMELALAGDSISERLQRLLVSGQMRGILTPLRQRVQHLGVEFRRNCLQELLAGRDAGVLAVGSGAELQAAGQNLQLIVDPQALVAEAQQLVVQAAALLQPYPHLAQLLADKEGGNTLLTTAFSYFLRQELAKHPELQQELQLHWLQQLMHNQAAGWEELYQLLAEQGPQIAAELAQLGAGFRAVAQGQEEIAGLVREVLQWLPISTRKGAVPPHLSSILRSAADIRLFEELERRVNSCPVEQRTVEMLDVVGRLAMAVGVFDKASDKFQQAALAADAAGATTAQAEALYNRYRALLEQRCWDESLAALVAAAQLDAAQFAPFPLATFLPRKILGAGGFGVAFLCRHAYLDYEVVVKTLHGEELERDIMEIFREGRMLCELQHPAIIRVTHADYASPERQRPYIVMEYFAGDSLANYLQQHGCLTLDQTLALARPIAEALQAAHKRGILHRDLKPDNLLVRMEADGSWAVKLIDFGLAVRNRVVQATVAAGNASYSLIGASCGGTYQFSAPEQLGFNSAKIGPWSDVYAFGKTMSFARFHTTQLTGRHYRELGSHPFAHLLSDCLEQDISLRPQDFAAVLQLLDTEDKIKRDQQQVVEQQQKEAEAKQQREAAAQQQKEAEAKQQREAAERQRKELYASLQREREDVERQRKELEDQQHLSELYASLQREREAVERQRKELEVKQQREAAERQRKELEAEKWKHPGRVFSDKFKSGIQGPEMVVIGPGKFLMGGTKYGNEQPIHEVTIAYPFAMGKFPVTFAEYDAFCVATGRSKPEDSGFGRDRRPVINVSWDEAEAYCQWLSEQTGNSYRLPSEAEWEYACRAGSTTDYCCGDDVKRLEQYAWFEENSNSSTHPVGEKLPNAWGLYDMHGNVWEWCQDRWHESYAGAPTTGCAWEQGDSSFRVLRGGSCYCNPSLVRSAYRNLNTPDSRSYLIGVRVASFAFART